MADSPQVDLLPSGVLYWLLTYQGDNRCLSGLTRQVAPERMTCGHTSLK